MPFQADTMLMRGDTGSGQDFGLLRAGQRIYDQWLVGVCSIEPERHIGLMHLPMWDIEAEDAIANGYADRVIWGSDYPHFDGTYQYDATGPNAEPMTLASLRFTYGGLPEDKIRMMPAGNAMNAYDFDYDALTRVADRINAPSYEELNNATVTERQADSDHLAFRTFGFWA
jgi:hypothetical protein